MPNSCTDCGEPGHFRARAGAPFCDAHWCSIHDVCLLLAPTGLQTCPGCAYDAGQAFRIMARKPGGMTWPEFDAILPRRST